MSVNPQISSFKELYSVEVNAKINLSLSVGEKENGYHLLSSLSVAVDLTDEVSFIRADETSVEIVNKTDVFGSNFPEIPLKNNSAFRAISGYNEYFGTKHAYKILIRKNIPSGGGLGGSSADAAGVLRLLCALDGREISCVLPVAQKVGKDVPFMLYGRNAIMSGTGEKLEFLPELKMDLTLINVKTPDSTAEIFREFDKNPLKFRENQARDLFMSLLPLVKAYKSGEISALTYKNEISGLNFDNSLIESAKALNPELALTVKKLENYGLKPFMTGSGSTLVLPWAEDPQRLCRELGIKSLIVTTV